MTMEQQQNKPTTSTRSVVVMFVVILGALVGASIYNMIDGRTVVGLAGLAVATSIVPVALKARAGVRQPVS